jgi:hypothetical protein
MHSIDISKLNGLIGLLSILVNLMNANLISPESKVKLPFEENTDNNSKDDSHLRLYYKSNSPSQSISHELEHRYVKSPNYRFSQETTNFRPNTNFGHNAPFNQGANDQSNIFLDSSDKNKQTMLNMHYHGNLANSLPILDSQQQANYQSMRNQPSSARKNLIKMLLMNFSPSSSSSNSIYSQDQQLPQQFQQTQSRFQFNPSQIDSFTNQQTKGDDALQYKIVHLKFKIQPQLGSMFFIIFIIYLF